MTVRAPYGFDGAVTGPWRGGSAGGIAQWKTMDLDVTRSKAESDERRCGVNGLSEKVGGEG